MWQRSHSSRESHFALRFGSTTAVLPCRCVPLLATYTPNGSPQLPRKRHWPKLMFRNARSVRHSGFGADCQLAPCVDDVHLASDTCWDYYYPSILTAGNISHTEQSFQPLDLPVLVISICPCNLESRVVPKHKVVFAPVMCDARRDLEAILWSFLTDTNRN